MATHHRRQTAPPSYEPSAERKEIIAAIMPRLDELNTSIAKRQAAKMASSSKTTRDSYQKGIDELRRRKQMTIAAMAFVHIMVESKLQRALTDLHTGPRGFAMLFVEQYGWIGCSILNYCKFRLRPPLWKYRLTLRDYLGSEKAPLSQDFPAGSRTNAAVAAQRLVGRWYGRRCIVTRVTQGDSCHIIPDCVEHVRNAEAFDTFWGSLFGFWDYEKISTLQDFIKDPSNTKRNLVVMGKETHARWSDHIFLLSPKESTGNSLRLEFKWVRPAGAIGQGVVLEAHGDYSPLFYHDPDGTEIHRIENGDSIELRTADHVNIPLPHSGLLSIQEALTIVCNASAAADVLKLLFDTPDVDPDLGAISIDETATAEPIPDPFVFDTQPRTFPHLTEYQIKAAVERGFIREDDVEQWRRSLTGASDEEAGPAAAAQFLDD